LDDRFAEALPAVEIFDAHKSYGSYNVLKDLNMFVPKGAM
jgi:hypothetical protein